MFNIVFEPIVTVTDCPYGIASSSKTVYRLTVKDGSKIVWSKDYTCHSTGLRAAKRAERILT